MLQIVLPWPPSVNHYWASNGKRRFITQRGVDYRRDVSSIAMAQFGSNFSPLTGRLTVRIEVYPPDRRTRDLDNLCKAPLDALAHAGIYVDDSQIDVLILARCRKSDNPVLVCLIEEMEPVNG